MLIFDSLSINLISLVITLFVAITGFYKWSYQYWKRRNMPYLEPRIPFGNSTGVGEHMAIIAKRFYDIMKEKKWKHGGTYFYATPVYVVVDLDYLKNIMTKDFQYFTDRGFYHNEKDDPLSAHLFSIDGAKWQNLRKKLTPTFTPGKMKMMFQTLMECEPNLQRKMEVEYKKNEPIDIKYILRCFVTDIIGSCAFGLDCNTFEENSPFRKFAKTFLETTTDTVLKRHFLRGYPNISRALGIKLTPKHLSDFFMKVVKQTVDYRQKNNTTRNDFMQLLIDMKNNNFNKDDGNTSLSIEEIAAHCFVFFIAGFETSSATLTFALYELAKNQEIQNKVRNEINTVLGKHQGKITYDAIKEMRYMNQVLDETLRKYPSGSVLPRKCVEDYKIPDEDIIIEKGTIVLIPVLGIHYDPEYYPDPEKFDPERFNEENKSSRNKYAHIPFGEGPRICIGLRFGLMQSKVGLTTLLKNFNFTVNRKTKEPLKMKPTAFILAAQGEIWLDAQKIQS